MNIDLSEKELRLLKMVLSKSELTTRVEIHHARSFDFKELLKERERNIAGLLKKIEQALPVEA